MPRTLLVTNDFPPRPGGIQYYLHTLTQHLPADQLVVFAPRWREDSHSKFDAEQPFPVVRYGSKLMLPTPDVAWRAKQLIREFDCDSAWFGAAAPLAVMAPQLRRAGAHSIVASTHGHEVGWSMLPVARQALRHIGNSCDTVSYVSQYTRGRFAAAFGPNAELSYLPPGVDTEAFKPDPAARTELRARYGLSDRPVIVCLSRLVPRKGQDMLIKALPEIRRRVPSAALIIVGGGPYRANLERLAQQRDVTEHVTFTGLVPAAELAAHHAMADVFAMPCRTRGSGLDVEGLGIVFLEASASGVPVVAGDSGGAPETVLEGETGHVVDGRSEAKIADAIVRLLSDPERAVAMGRAGREWVQREWRWDVMAHRLQTWLTSPQ